jgi:hypothetical protein
VSEQDPTRDPAAPPAIRPNRDHSQRPQKAIKLKPSIAREPPSPVTHLGPPREQLGGVAAPPTSGVSPPPVSPPALEAPPATALSADTVEAIVQAAQAAGTTPDQWVSQAIRRAERQARVEGPVRYEELVLFALRDMNERLSTLEDRAAPRGWLRRLFGG